MAAADARIGHLLGGKYRVQQLLAAGGMGFVYAARHDLTGRAVALKLLRPELVTRPDLVERVSREARLAVDAAHPNVVEVLDAGADQDGAPYLVLERLYGHTLEALLDQPLSLGSTLEALVPVCNALAALHEAGIVHRDLKPANIFLSREEGGRVTPKLLDFGIAKVLEGSGATLTGVTLGTPAYMAPEQLLCGVTSPASDVWSLAVMCVRCLTGRLPFVELAQRGLLAFGKSVRPSELDGIPAPIARVLAAALHFEAGERPANAGAFRAQLLAALRELDADRAWPDASSIGFGEHESELARAVMGRDELAKTMSAGVGAIGRPPDVLTRTIAHAWQTVWRGRALWQRRLALVAVLSALGLVIWTGLARMHPRALPAPLAATAELSALPEPATAAGSPASPPRPTTALPAPKPLPVTSAQGDRERKNVRRDPARPTPAPSVSRLEPAAPKPEGHPALPAPVLGANRSPIIE
jgi:hypothetical protein